MVAMEEEGVLANAEMIGRDHLGPGLRHLQERHPIIGEVRGLGVFFALDLVKDRATREPLAPYGGTSEAMAALVSGARAKGLLVFSNYHRIHCVPPCTVTDGVVTDVERDLGLSA
jgi:taurine--2-oxoglutarate transaminase